MEVYIAGKTKDIDWHHTSFNKPASEAEIISLENELDLKIPDEYRDLLKFSNGFEFFGVSSDFLSAMGKDYFSLKSRENF